MSSSGDWDRRGNVDGDGRGDPEIVRVRSGRGGQRTVGVVTAVVIVALGLAVLKPWAPTPQEVASPSAAPAPTTSPSAAPAPTTSPSAAPAPSGHGAATTPPASPQPEATEIAAVADVRGPLDGPPPVGRAPLPWRIAWDRVGTSFGFDAWGIVAIAVPSDAASGPSGRVPTLRTWTPVAPVRGDGASDDSVRSGVGGGPPAVGEAGSNVVAIGFTWPIGIRITDIRLDHLVGMVDGRIASVGVPLTPIDRAADPDNRALPSISGLWWGAPPDAASRGSGAATFGDSWPPGPYRLHFEVSGQPRSVTFSLRSAVAAASYSSVVP